MTRLALALAVALATASGALAQDVVTPLGGGLYRAEFWTTDVDTLYTSDRTAPPDTVLVRVVYGAEDAVSPVVGVRVEAEGDSLRYRYTVGNGPEGPRALYRFELLPDDYADDLQAPDATWRAGAHRRANAEGKIVEITRYGWTQTRNYTPDGSAYLPETLQPGVSLDGFSLLSAGLPAVVDARASADRLLYPEDSTLAVYGLWSVAQVVNHGRAPTLEALRYESRYAPLRTLGPRAIPNPLDGPAFLDTLLADVREADALGWFGAATATGSAVEGKLAEARDAWAAGDSVAASSLVQEVRNLVETAADVRTEGRALVSFNAAFLADLLPSPSDGVARCDGRPATIYVSSDGLVVGGPRDGERYDGTLRGTDGPDVIVGTDAKDKVEAGGGDDLVCGLGGDDDLKGERGDDTLLGGAGDDKLDGKDGRDTLVGGDGDDDLKGGKGNDVLNGGAGRDKLEGEDGNDELAGGPGDDDLKGGSGDDRLSGGAGRDKVAGEAGRDTLAGGAGDDELKGGGDADDLSGGDGNDTLDGEGGADRLDGGPGDDRLKGGGQDDVLVGGPGEDEADGGGDTDLCAAETEKDCEGDPDGAPDTE